MESQIGQVPVHLRTFLSMAKTFKFDWKEIEQRKVKLWVKDQCDVRRQMEQIKQTALIIAKPIKAELKGNYFKIRNLKKYIKINLLINIKNKRAKYLLYVD